jgi:hypothetical protein
LEINLTGLNSCDYTVNYTPKIISGEAAVCENRFFIRISKTSTGLKETIAGTVNVYKSSGLIQIISNAANPVKEIAVYNLQGALLYKTIPVNSISHTIKREWPAGVYIVKVISEKSIDNIKVIM